MLFGLELNIYAFVGIIMLIGIVKKNAIMMIDFAHRGGAQPRQERRTRRSSRPRSVRFRPIMMTTMAALMGTLPIALGHGAGAESRRPLGLAVVGGLLLLADPHALHHAGDLHLLRRAPAAARPAEGEGAGQGAGREPAPAGAMARVREV